VSRRKFAGYWEYLLEDAIFTSPPRPDFGGAALIDRHGELVGIGSLFVMDAETPGERLPGNMFVPIDHLKPILARCSPPASRRVGAARGSASTRWRRTGASRCLRVSATARRDRPASSRATSSSRSPDQT
jgi:hypothetical protein